MDSLVTLIARQSELKLLNLALNSFTEEQEQRVRCAVANTECRLIFTREEYDSYEAEQRQQAEAAASAT